MQPTRETGFTLIELLIVISIIIVLAGLILATSGFVQAKGKRSRAEAEIAALSAALENYKADNGTYPQSTDTDSLDPAAAAAPEFDAYAKAAATLYQQLSGDRDGDPATAPDTTNYISAFVKPNSLATPAGSSRYLKDPFLKPYGYSTAKAATPSGTAGYNPTFDLWSTAGTITGSAADRAQWIKNW